MIEIAAAVIAVIYVFIGIGVLGLYDVTLDEEMKTQKAWVLLFLWPFVLVTFTFGALGYSSTRTRMMYLLFGKR